MDAMPSTEPMQNNPASTILMNESSKDLGKLFEALAKAQASMRPAVMDSKNPHYNSKFASLTACQEAYKKPLAENGLCLTQQVFSVSQHFFIRSILGHSSGQWMSNVFRLILTKNDMQGLGSAITYGRRYGANSLIGVVDTEDDDGNGALPPVDPKKNNPPKNTKPPVKNHAPGASNQEPPAIDRSEPFPEQRDQPPMTFLEYLVQLVDEKGIAPLEVTDIIKRVTGTAKKANMMNDDELKAVINFIEMAKK